MILPDQSHINRIREALWERPEGCASVMVGAGFSRNARKAGPDAREFPLWNEITLSLCNRLYPSGDGDRFNRAIAEASGTSGFLRLAQEYEAAFGRGALHNLIQDLVPDEDYVPDDMHVRLLRLPWRDVFTTNWDTLLERTRFLVADRAYGVVRTYDEIPSASRPRIVKLHGSFPAHFPFIFTEEDFRAYPKQFAPFVNTVQQAMMETVFCLIGFSGDDPNFLHWSGWVRDNLGKLAPKIYLAGWLDLSPHRRRMLEERNVVAIDLSRHPQASIWPDHLRHRYATDWILHTLERGRPYEFTDWPSLPNWGRSPVPDLLQPVEDVMVDAPIEEPRPPESGEDLKKLSEQVRGVIRAWEFNRKVYPGWLIFPPNKHFQVEISMRGWEHPILRALPELSCLERLSAFRELAWRREKLLEPLLEKAETAVQTVLEDIECQSRQIGGTKDQSARWADIRESWRDLAMALLTEARHRFDREAFDRCLATLHPFIDDHPDVAQRIHHEKCLWALYALDFASLDKLLKEWHPENCDPAWMLRKAAVLIETGRDDEAVRLLNRSLSIVREAPGEGRTIASASREGWILWTALAFKHGFSRSTDEVLDAPPAFRRWKQLSILQCDAFEQKQEFLRALRGDLEKKEAPLFDLGARRGKSIHFSNAAPDRRIAPRRAIRLCELAGLPPLASHMVVASDILTLAAEHLVTTTDYALASRIALRVATHEDDTTFNRVWTRSRVAAMPMDEVTALGDLITNMIPYVLPRATSVDTNADFWVTRLRVAMEALSRLVLRFPPERAEQIFRQALTYLSMEAIVKHPWLSKPMNHLLYRAWEALPKSSRTGLIFDILSTPIAGIDGFETIGSFPDPGELLLNDDETTPPPCLPKTDGRWSEIVHLINRALGRIGEARRRAAFRLWRLTLWGCLTDLESTLFASTLWHPNFTGSDTLPSDTSLYDWTFLLLPEPEIGLAEKQFRKKWLGSQEPKDEQGFNELFNQLGYAFENLKRLNRPLTLTVGEQEKLSTIVEKWAMFPVKSDYTPFIELDTRKGFDGLQFILSEFDLPPSVAGVLFAKVDAMNQTNIPGFRLLPGILKSLPDRRDDVAMSIRMGLASDKAALAEEALLGLGYWLKVASEEKSTIPLPSEDSLREIGVIIATRRKGVLNRGLQIARWIFSNGSIEQRDTIANLTLNGLSYLIEELRYDRDHVAESELEIPLLRWGCAHLALAMFASGYESDPIVKRWAEVAKDDPLPEVRHADHPALVNMQEEKLGTK